MMGRAKEIVEQHRNKQITAVTDFPTPKCPLKVHWGDFTHVVLIYVNSWPGNMLTY